MSTNPNYRVTCDPATGLCTAKLKVSTARAYAIPSERRGPSIVDRVKKSGDSEYLGFGFKVEVREIDEAKRTVPFIASTPAVDRYGDVIEQGGWVLDFYKRNPIVLFAHDSRSLPIGKALSVGVVNGSLFALLQFAKPEEYEFADQVFRLVLGGYLNTLSVGFIPLEFKYRYEEVSGGEDPKPWPIGRIYTKSELLENSVVPVPANPEAVVVGRSYELKNLPEKYGAAFRAVEVEEETKFERYERSYFVLDGKLVVRFGTKSPVDSKVVDAYPFLAVGDGDEHATISASSEESAKAKTGIREGFLCELAGADVEGNPVYRSIFAISPKEISPKIENQKMPSNSGNSNAQNLSDQKSVVPFHAYPLASTDAPWDASKEMGSTDKSADWRKMSTIVLGDGEKKGDFKLPHHRGPGAKFATVRRGVANALARAGQVKGASAADKAGARKHLSKHMSEFHKDDGKDFDLSAFESEIEKIEAFRDAVSCEECRERITRAMVEYAIDPRGHYAELLSFALAFPKIADDAGRKDLLEEFAKAFPETERKFTNQKMNKKLASAHKKMSAAKDELDTVQKEASEMLSGAISSLASMISSEVGNAFKDTADGGDPEPAASRLGDSTVAESLAMCHESASGARKAVTRMVHRYQSYMQDAIEHLESLLDYVAPDDSDDDGDDDSGDTGGQDDDAQGKQDDPLYSQKPNADSDGQSPDDKTFSEIATNLSVKASNDSTGSAPDKSLPPSQAESAIIEFLDGIGEGKRQAS